LGYHTLEQVLVGTLLGVGVGGMWMVVTEAFLVPLFPTLCASSLGRMLYIRDLTGVRDVISVEYEASVAAATEHAKQV
jgi:dolichyldiphosphatase